MNRHFHTMLLVIQQDSAKVCHGPIVRRDLTTHEICALPGYYAAQTAQISTTSRLKPEITHGTPL